MDVSIVIVNYNTKQLTTDCIDSIVKYTDGIEYEIILVDNASTDGSREHFAQDTRIKFIPSSENIGFGRANNKGLEVATGKYVFFLNSDTYLLGNAIKKLYDFAEGYQGLNIGEIGVMLIDKQGKINKPYSELPDANPFKTIMNKMGIGSDAHKVIEKKLSLKGYAEVGFICGADVFAPKRVLDRIGAFDPNIFMFAEEIDLAKRMERNGYSRVVIDNSEIVHLGSSSFTKEKLLFKKYYWSTLGVSIYGNNHFKGIQLLWYRMFRLVMLVRDVYIKKSVQCDARQRRKLVNTLFRSDIRFDDYFDE